MPVPWNVLIVDDEEDVHGVTTIALKRKNWRGRPIALKSARSGKQARELLQAPDAPNFQAALVDVVMETNDAGLQLCDFIRSNMPRTMRIILRTGQPGAAPPDKVLNDYDIDYYLAKTEVTEERLYSVLRACFRSSLDISALIAVAKQLRSFTTALQGATTTRDNLVAIMTESLKFLEDKYAANIAFVPDAKMPTGALPAVDAPTLAGAIAKGHKAKLAPLTLHKGTEVGLAENIYLVLTASLSSAKTEKGVGERMKRWFQSIMTESAEPPEVGLGIQVAAPLIPRTATELAQDLELFLSNWAVAESSLRLQDKMVSERMEMLKHVGGT